MKKFLFLTAMSLLLFSCNKKYHVIGRVYNPVTGEGLANVKVEFFRSTVGEIPAGNEEITSTLTDANGNYDLEFKGRAERIQIELNQNLYKLGSLDGGIYQQALRIDPKKTQQIDWHAVPYGKLKTTLNNAGCEGATDVIILNASYRIKPDAGIFGTGTYNGCYNNTTTSSEIPMGYYDFTWTVTKTSTGTNTFTEEVFVPAGGIGEITIDY